MLPLAHIREAVRLVAPHVRRTPVELAPRLSERLGRPVYLKLESLQITGSFKVRGALVALARSPGTERVATCSAGNHGIGLAWAGRVLGRRVRVYLPRSVDPYKARALEELGAETIKSEFDGFDDTEEWALEQCRAAGLPFISAYDHPDIMAGNGGTIGMEIAEQLPSVRTVVVPVGGGGMASGMVSAFARLSREVRLVACQLAACPALQRSLDAGRAMTRMPAVETLAGGLEGGLGKRPFAVLRDSVSQVVHVEEAAIADAMRWLLETHHYVVEPSCAVALSACLSGQVQAEGDVVLVLSGRNVALSVLRRILAA